MSLIVFLAETFFLLILIYFGRDFLKKRIKSLFGNIKTPPLYLLGFRLLLGVLLMERLYHSYYGTRVLSVRPTSFFRIDMIYDLFFSSDYRFIILIIIPLIFVILFIFEWKPRLTSALVFLYSVIGGTIDATVTGSLGRNQHAFHVTALMLLGFTFFYWFYYKRNSKRWEWMIFPILLFFVATIYGSSFMSKMSYLLEVPKWFSGEAVQSAIIQGHYQRVLTSTFGKESLGTLSPIPQFVARNKPIAAFLGIGVLLIEFSSILLLIASSKLRLFILISLALFNVGTAVLILAHFNFNRNILVLLYIIIWAAYNAFPRLGFDRKREL